VSCTATDVATNTATCGFLITLTRPVPAAGLVGLAGLVVMVGGLGVWALYRRRHA
jgi:hypothetical protein